MRLNEMQRAELDKAIVNIAKTLGTGYISVGELLDMTESLFNERLHQRNVTAAIDRLYYDDEYMIKLVGWGGSTYKIENIGVAIPVEFTKDKNIIHFGDNLDYDFITKKFSADLGTKVKIGSPQIGNRHWLLDVNDFMKLIQYEWLFNYTNDLNIIFFIVRDIKGDRLKTMPQGLLEYLNRENKTFNSDNLREYYNLVEYGVDGYKFIKRFSLNVYEQMIKAGITIKDINKLACNSVKNCKYDLYYEVKDIINMACQLKVSGIAFELDKNRDLAYNVKLLENIRDKEKNELLAKKLQKLNFINGFTHNDYVVVVPQSQEDKIAEGQMQNNCVGYYYDTRILEDRDLIYFIRKADSPNKSYMTCRYNKSSNDTVEYRLVNNNSVKKAEDKEMVALVTKMIKENL